LFNDAIGEEKDQSKKMMSLLEQWREESRNAVKKKSYSTIERETMPKKSLQAKSIRGPINKRLIDTII